MDSRDYVLGAIYYSVACQHSQQTSRRPNAVSMLAHHLRRWPNIKPALVRRLVFDGLHSIAAVLVLLTAVGDYNPTPTQCLLNAGPALPVVASNHLVLVRTSCWQYQHAGGICTML